MKRALLLLAALTWLVLPAIAQSNTYHPNPLTDYSPCSTLYLSVYTGCLYDTSPFSGVGSNTPPTQYDTDAKAAMNRVVPLDVSGNPCSKPYTTGCHIGMIFLGMSIPGRDTCYGLASGTLSSPCVAESLICQAVGTQVTGTSFNYGCPRNQYLDCDTSGTGGNARVNHACNTGNQPIFVLVNCAFESEQLEQWQTDTQGNYARCDTQLSNHGLTPQQVEVVWVMGVDTQPEGGALYQIPAACCDMQHLIDGADSAKPGDTTCDNRDYSGTNYPYPSNPAVKSSTQIDLCMYLVNMGIVSRFIKTQRYPNTQQIFWNAVNSTGWNTSSAAQPEPFAYETGFGIKNGIMAQQKQKAGGYSSPAHNLQTLDVNYDCSGATCVLNTNTTCSCTTTTCGTHQNAAWACAPIWIWGAYEWAPCDPNGGNGCTAPSKRADGYSYELSDFTSADYVHPKSLGTASDAGIMKVNTDSAGGALTGSSSGLLNNTYASAWLLEALTRTDHSWQSPSSLHWAAGHPFAAAGLLQWLNSWTWN